MTQNNKYLDHEGVSYLWGKMKEYIDNECANNSNILIPKYVSRKSDGKIYSKISYINI